MNSPMRLSISVFAWVPVGFMAYLAATRVERLHQVLKRSFHPNFVSGLGLIFHMPQLRASTSAL
jgi:hypothetical protein